MSVRPKKNKFFSTETEMLAFGSEMAKHISPGTVLFLSGPLGAGKTTFTRGFLRGLGYSAKVKSPTYTLVESYEFTDKIVFHFDFYRINTENELDEIGIHDYFTENSICLIEWPEKGLMHVPSPDIIFYFSIHNTAREIQIEIKTDKGKVCCQ